MVIDLNFKKIYFFLSLGIIFLLIQIISFLFFYFSLFNIDNLWIYFFLIVFEFALFIYLSKKILNPIFKSDEMIESSIKNTLHELNIPVSTIKLNIDLIKTTIKDEKTLARIERVRQANENLIKLYKNMEYQLKKELEKIELEEFYLENVLNESLLKFEEQKELIKFDINIININLYADYHGFIIVLDNLISNAIKYNSKDNPYIKIVQKDTIFSIYNRGKSIIPENIMLVFERYFQENSLNKGYGIGLAIIKEYCDKYKIAINIEALEDGTKVSLNLKNIIKQA
ncbi:Signal transduction histidine-protein kinase/phosphatase MprB [Aliarcobacter thereius]|uniref:histidine kinase n=3 Tax=Aliarcobacter thereius TaxID=544718 RepID=A0A1C0B6U5_9BACT|nr:Signal transduction histidine-protein kinase/phosphatase MprB [Aliarcobacter thereius]OCL91171.1 Signal transduction histidine-protein kinase/phosphatase MprB [Aliarcobacter thereius]OCL95978.1 Signal transduction histidine-protein kinase/phosphatase MprB [Aliarcobacter thereius LMG 24486]OCL99307.1 Signal transduction histidine-protein kinase/phosphatase MprB [Aliarcobacter thereius]